MKKPTDQLIKALKKYKEKYVQENGSEYGAWNIFKKSGISGPTIGRIANGRTKNPDNETWNALYYSAPDIIPKPPWLFVTADGKLDFNVFDPILTDDDIEEYPEDVKQMIREEFDERRNTGEHTTIPLAQQKVSAGNGHLIIETEKTYDLAFRRDWLSKRGGTYMKVVLPVTGDSMEPIIAHGDVVLVDQSEDGKIVRNGQIYIVNDPDNGVFVKQVYQEKTGLQLVSYNKSYPPCFLPVPEGAVSPIIGRVIWWAHAVDPD